MSIYVAPRLAEDRRGPMAVAIVIHLALLALLLTVKAAIDLPKEGGSPAIQLIAFPQAGESAPRTGGGGGSGVVAELPLPSVRIETSGERLAPALAAPDIPAIERVDRPIDNGATFSLSREAELRFPTLTSSPPYPPAMERQGVETDLRLRLDIDADGRVTGATPIGSHHRAFLQSTIDHIMARWRFRPKLVNDEAVASRRVFLFQFRIEMCGDEFCQKVTGVAD